MRCMRLELGCVMWCATAALRASPSRLRRSLAVSAAKRGTRGRFFVPRAAVGRSTNVGVMSTGAALHAGFTPCRAELTGWNSSSSIACTSLKYVGKTHISSPMPSVRSNNQSIWRAAAERDGWAAGFDSFGVVSLDASTTSVELSAKDGACSTKGKVRREEASQ